MKNNFYSLKARKGQASISSVVLSQCFPFSVANTGEQKWIEQKPKPKPV